MDLLAVFALIGHHTMKLPNVLVVESLTARIVYKQNVQDAKKKMIDMGYIIFANHVFPTQAVRHATMKTLYFVLNA